MRRLWIALGVVTAFGFAVHGWIGTRIYQEMPPIPERVVTGYAIPPRALTDPDRLHAMAAFFFWTAHGGDMPEITGWRSGRHEQARAGATSTGGDNV